MKILGIDTTTRFLCLGIYDGAHPLRNTAYSNKYSKISNGAKVYEYNLEACRGLSSLLAVTIKRILGALGWQASDIDYFACSLGPGSFTGMRTGLSTIKGMSLVLNKPVIGVSSLDILAQGVRHTDKLIVPIVDAKRNLIYCSVYKKKNGQLKRVRPYMLLTEAELTRSIKGNAIILGDAVGLYREKILMNINGATILDKDYWYPKAHNIIELALLRIKAKKFSNSFGIKPIYLYPKECQIRKSVTSNRVTSNW